MSELIIIELGDQPDQMECINDVSAKPRKENSSINNFRFDRSINENILD